VTTLAFALDGRLNEIPSRAPEEPAGVERKILPLAELGVIAQELRAKGRKVVLAHGTFDLLHIGHVRHLHAARNQGDVLMVTITADAFVNKGPGRPVFPEGLRSEMLASLEIVDYVGIVPEPDALPAIRTIRPYAYVKGQDYRNPEGDLTGRIVSEIYGFAPCEYVLLSFLQSLSKTTQEEVAGCTYIKEGEEAINQLLHVASGLDSQIPGDYEIIGQIRNAFQLSKKFGRANGYIEKVVNQAVLVSKTIKNSTAFSDGTVSVSYAVVQQVKKLMEQENLRKICVVGLGKIGHNTLKYLLQHAPDAQITLVNRDENKLQ